VEEASTPNLLQPCRSMYGYLAGVAFLGGLRGTVVLRGYTVLAAMHTETTVCMNILYWRFMACGFEVLSQLHLNAIFIYPKKVPFS
jgi:hypothetical protein